jgi:hypothetical protein
MKLMFYARPQTDPALREEGKAAGRFWFYG